MTGKAHTIIMRFVYILTNFIRLFSVWVLAETSSEYPTSQLTQNETFISSTSSRDFNVTESTTLVRTTMILASTSSSYLSKSTTTPIHRQLRIEPSQVQWLSKGMPFKLRCIFNDGSTLDPNSGDLKMYHTPVGGTRSELTMNSKRDLNWEFEQATKNLVLTVQQESIDSDNAGEYECSYQSSKTSTNVMVLSVENKDVVFNKSLETKDQKETYKLECKASINGPSGIKRDFTVKWTKNGTKLEDNSRFETNSTVLTIKKAEMSDIGRYQCAFMFDVGSSNKLVLNHYINFTAAPVVDGKKLTKSRNVMQGDTMKLECPVTGYPEPQITWFKDHKKVEETGPIKLESNGKVIAIYSLEFEHRGNYSCKANNSLGSDEKFIMIRVKDRLAALWPFLGIVAEVIVLCIIIFIYEKKRSKELEDDTDGADEAVGNAVETKGKDEVRQRNVRT